MLTDDQWREQITAFVDSRNVDLPDDTRAIMIDLLTVQAIACAPVFFERDRLREDVERLTAALDIADELLPKAYAERDRLRHAAVFARRQIANRQAERARTTLTNALEDLTPASDKNRGAE